MGEDVLDVQASSGILIQDAVTKAILTNNAPKELQEHLLMNSGKYPDSNAIVEAIQAYALHNRMWTPSTQGHAPMDIGGMMKGDNGKGNGKGKSNQKWKYNEKGKSE